MRYELAKNNPELVAYLPRFLTLIGTERWRKRALQLAEDAQRSFSEAKIVADYHWLELSLSKQMIIYETSLDQEALDLDSLAAMYFAGTVVEVYDQLSPVGQSNLKGRLIDSLKSENGFASLYLEMAIAQRLIDDGFEVMFCDMEGTGQYDLAFSRLSISGEVECKSISVDAGRQIHRKEFYRFVHSIESDLVEHAITGADDLIFIMLNKRLPKNLKSQAELRSAALRILRSSIGTTIDGSFFRIERAQSETYLSEDAMLSSGSLAKACNHVFGDNCHIAGPVEKGHRCIVIMRSSKPDDTSYPILEAMRKAASQLTGERAGFIVFQFDDILPADLLEIGLRRRMGLLSYALFMHYGATHICATYFSPFRGLAAAQGVGFPAFSIVNPEPRFRSDPNNLPPFLNGLSDEKYAELLGASSLNESLSVVPLRSSG